MRESKRLMKILNHLRELEERCMDKGIMAQDACLQKSLEEAICSVRAVRIRLREDGYESK